MKTEVNMEEDLHVNVETLTAASMASTISFQVLSILSRLTKKSTSVNEAVKQEEELQVFTLDEVSLHDHEADCWMIIYDRVYDVTDFLQKHPGGEFVMLEYAGRDATLAFRGSHVDSAEQALKPYLIGILDKSERIWT